MRPALGSLAAASAPATTRLIVAAAASVAVHALAALAFALSPPGTPLGRGSESARPLQARLVGPDAPGPGDRPAPLEQDARVARPVEKPAASRATGTSPAAEAAQAFGLREEPVHYLPSELEVRPRLRSQIDPPYPQIAPADGGYVVLQLLIGETGAVEKVVVVVADPAGYFEQTAIDAFARARFSPGRRGGVAVKSQTWIEVKFHPLAPSGVAAAADPGEPPR
jgi:TonB family protein